MSLPVKGIIYEALSGYHFQTRTGDARRTACADFELNMAECLEAYGVRKGYDLCYKYIEDLHECKSKHLQTMRSVYINHVRTKKLITGEIPWEKRRSEPVPYDAFISGVFYP